MELSPSTGPLWRRPDIPRGPQPWSPRRTSQGAFKEDVGRAHQVTWDRARDGWSFKKTTWGAPVRPGTPSPAQLEEGTVPAGRAATPAPRPLLSLPLCTCSLSHFSLGLDSGSIPAWSSLQASGAGGPISLNVPDGEAACLGAHGEQGDGRGTWSVQLLARDILRPMSALRHPL